MTTWYRLKTSAKHFSELVAFEHTIFSASFILIAMCVASLESQDSLWVGWRTFILCMLALVGARNFAMGFNRLCDRDIDARNNRTKHRPSVDGRISVRSIVVFCTANALIFILVSSMINTLALILSVPFLCVLGGYSFMKRCSSLSHLVLGVALGLAPISGVIAVQGDVPLWSVLLAFGVVFWVAGFDVLYSLQDMKIDKQEGLFSIPSRFGAEKSLIISRVCHICAVGLWCGFVYMAGLGILAWIGVGLSMCMLIYEQYLVHRDFANIPRAFFVTNGYLGFILLACIVGDGVVRLGGL